VRFRRHGRFHELVERQLDLFASDDAELLDDADALAAARDGARRAREELTWDAAAAAHLALYEEIT